LLVQEVKAVVSEAGETRASVASERQTDLETLGGELANRRACGAVRDAGTT